MEGLQSVGLSFSYAGNGGKILEEFLLPCLDVAVRYDRVTSFYTVESLLAVSQGIQSLYERGGTMRLIIGVHSFPADLADAVTRRAYIAEQVAQVRQDIVRGTATIADSLARKRLATLAWMIEDGLLTVKAASVAGEGIFHPKTIIMADAFGDEVAAVGSPNETASGLGGNFEQLMLAMSWTSSEAVDVQKRFFETLWNDEHEEACVCDVSEGLAKSLHEALGNEALKGTGATATEPAHQVLSLAAQMPANFFVSGHIPALFPHQEHAVIQALSRWPVRVLFADEVGLGKTFEAAATMAFLMRYCGIKRVLILTPKSVLQQWQDELADHFGIDAWLYDSARKAYRNPRGKELRLGNKNPLGKDSPNVMLMSAQYARGGGGRKDVFSRAGTILPELLMLDEAHSARVSVDISGKRTPTLMYRMLENVTRKIPHIILATATPMQKEAEEYHALLKLLGLTKIWQRTSNYRASLMLTTAPELSSYDDAAKAGKLLRSTIRMMNPGLTVLNDEERKAVDALLALPVDASGVAIADQVLGAWPQFRGAFIKLHPAHLLTVRNTRRSLAEMGYRFPRRDLRDVTVNSSSQMQVFYLKVSDYITDWYFAVEEAFHPNKKLSLGFVRVGYQQRVSSSLWSCRQSLSRRFEKLMALKQHMLDEGLISTKPVAGFGISEEFDEMDADDLFERGNDLVLDESPTADFDAAEVLHAIDMETMTLAPLIAGADALLADSGDQKIRTSIRLALEHVAKKDQVLLFSRYADTVEALVRELHRASNDDPPTYGVYTGQKAVVVSQGTETSCTKDEIKRGLNRGDIRLMVCSDAASEGLNLQAARVLINVDVPWTPSRLEQRIGRVARLGQVASSVDIYNVWYPNSIEHNMYRRIQKRLEESNLAVGEFPDVVADNIKNIVLEDQEQELDIVGELQELRNSMQVQALSELWSQRDSRETMSGLIRKRLLQLCDETLPCVGSVEGQDVKRYRLPDGSEVYLTARDGQDESISLTSAPWQFKDVNRDDIGFVRDAQGNPSAFAKRDDWSSWLTHESLVDLIGGGPIGASAVSGVRPSSLADTGSLDMTFAFEGELHDRPSFWPPVIKG